MTNLFLTRWMIAVLMAMGAMAVAETLNPGDGLRLTLRGVAVEEQRKINGDYTVGDDGLVRLPLLDQLIRAQGLTPGGFARSVEDAYREGGIYSAPAVDVVAHKAPDEKGAIVSVGGEVRRAGQVPFRQGMTVIQALDAVGGRNPFGGRNVMLLRDGQQYVLDFKQLSHKNLVLKANDSLQVAMKPPLIDRWKGNPEAVAALIAKP